MYTLKIRVLSQELVDSIKQMGLLEWTSVSSVKQIMIPQIMYQFYEVNQRIDIFDDAANFDPDFEYGKAISWETYGFSKSQIIARKQLLKLVLNEAPDDKLYDTIEEVLSFRLDALYHQLSEAIRIDPEASPYALISQEQYTRNLEYLNFLGSEIRSRRFDVELMDSNQININIEIVEPTIQLIKVFIQVKEGQVGRKFIPSGGIQMVEQSTNGNFNRLKLKLTVEQVCVLFRILRDSGLFFDPEVNLTEVNRFIERNFATKRVAKISLNTIENNTAPGYQFDKPEAKGDLLNLVNKVKELILPM